MKKAACLILLLLVCQFPARAQILVLNDNFEKCDLNVQDLPLGTRWFSTNPQRLTMLPGSMVFDTSEGSGDMIMTYFTDEEPVTLNPGESISAQLTFETRGILHYPDGTKDSSLRVALLNSNGSRYRGLQKLESSGPLNKNYEGFAGFMAFQNQDNSYFSIQQRTAGQDISEKLIDTAAVYKKLGNGTEAKPLSDSVKYILEFNVERKLANALTITVGISNRELTGFSYSTICNIDPAQDRVQFDTFLLKVSKGNDRGSSLAEKFTFTKFRVVKSNTSLAGGTL